MPVKTSKKNNLGSKNSKSKRFNSKKKHNITKNLKKRTSYVI